jgi:hypothetical protein
MRHRQRAKVQPLPATIRGDRFTLGYATESRMKSILDPTFHYVPSAQTDLRKTFSRVRREMARAKAQASRESLAPARVLVLSRTKELASR